MCAFPLGTLTIQKACWKKRCNNIERGRIDFSDSKMLGILEEGNYF